MSVFGARFHLVPRAGGRLILLLEAQDSLSTDRWLGKL
jgi:hypothetical protein